MQITLKNLKHIEALSEETHCFSATVYIDGKKAGTVQNAGHGGPNDYHPWSLAEQLDAYGKTLPKLTGYGMEIDQCADTIIGDLVNAMLAEKHTKQQLNKHILFVEDEAMYQYNIKLAGRTPDQREFAYAKVREKHPRAVILNALPLDEAVTLMRKYG